jgi:CHAT domain-containing protein
MTTKELMVKFYRELEVTGNATLALANARKAIMDSRPQTNNEQRGFKIVSSKETAGDFSGRTNPFYWAPFVVVESGL